MLMRDIAVKDAQGAQNKWESKWKDHSLSILSSMVRSNFPKADATALAVGTLVKFSEINKVEDTDGNETIHLVGLTSEISVVSLKLADVLSGLDITSKQFLWDLAGYFTYVQPEEEQKNHKMLLPPVLVTLNSGGVLNFRLVNVTSENKVLEDNKLNTQNYSSIKCRIPRGLQAQTETAKADEDEDLIIFRNTACKSLSNYDHCYKGDINKYVGGKTCKVHSIYWTKGRGKKGVQIVCHDAQLYFSMSWEEFKNSLRYNGYSHLSSIDSASEEETAKYLEKYSFQIKQADLYSYEGKKKKFISSLTIKEIY